MVCQTEPLNNNDRIGFAEQIVSGMLFLIPIRETGCKIKTRLTNACI
jgi:hypothetical protein